MTIPQHERKAVWRLLSYSLLLASSYTLTRTVGDSLFLARMGSENLAGVFVASGLTTAVIASAWYGLTRRLSLEMSLRISGVVFSAFSLTAWWLLPSMHHSLWLLGGIYLLAEVKGCVNTINAITSINDILGGHSSRHSWAAIGLAVPLASISMGILISAEAGFFRLRTWLLLAAVFDLLAVLPLASVKSLRIPKIAPGRLDALSSVMEHSLGKAKKYLNVATFRFWIGLLIATKIVALTIISFEWKVSVDAFYDSNETELTRYFGIFHAFTGALTLLIQAIVTGRLLSRRRIAFPLLVMPVALLALNTLFVFGTGIMFLAVVTTAARSMHVWRRSVHDTTLNLLYTKIDRDKRRSTIAANTAVVKPLSEVSASLVLLFGAIQFHGVVLLGATGLWLLATLVLLRLIHKIRRASKQTASPAVEPNDSMQAAN